MGILGEIVDDHGGFTRSVDALAALVARVESGASGAEGVHEDFVRHCARLHDELLEHFGVEEECIFPFLAHEFPELQSEITQLEASHDKICGSLERLLHLSRRGGVPAFVGSFPQVTHVFRRFHAAYRGHVARESQLLTEAATNMDPAQRARLDDAADGLL